jgi:hypothetical protein
MYKPATPERGHCEARPGFVGGAERPDSHCARWASQQVPYHGEFVLVCRVHEQAYIAWASDAEWNAGQVWGWRESRGRISSS